MDLSIDRFMMQTPQSSRRIAQIREFSDALTVMTATSGTPAILDRHDGFVETKWDGTRGIIMKKGRNARFFNGRGRQTDQTLRYPKVISDAMHLDCASCILDGEFVFFDARGMQYYLNISARNQTIYERDLKYKFMAFDILEKDGKNLRDHPIEFRKKVLDSVVPGSLPIIDVTDIIRTNIMEFFVSQLQMGREGVMFKANGSPYVAGRSDYWLKIKRHETVDVIAKGMTAGTGERIPYFGALKCYLPDGHGGFRHIGNVGGGFTQRNLIEVLPFARSGKPFVIEVKIMEWTRDGRMRMPSFVRMRPDKTIEEVGN